jgi:hypothetical protein
MINIKDIVDNAIKVNKEKYLHHINQFHYWDKKEHEKWAVMHHHTAHEIEETIKRIFGSEHKEYIENQFTKLRVYESELYSK